MDGLESLDVSSLIPHGEESILLDRIVEHDESGTTTSLVVGKNSWLLREDESFAPWLAVEYFAQSIAAHEGLIALSDGRIPTIGFLVSVVGLELQTSTLRRGERLEVRTQRVRGRPGLGVLSHFSSLDRIGDADKRERIAHGRLSISIPRS
jgi:predicted hotdog family 3-hydroxylacyl-ACP dehydratase